jgi:hypothetical protein
MGAGQLQLFPQEIRQIEPRQNISFDPLAVHLK